LRKYLPVAPLSIIFPLDIFSPAETDEIAVLDTDI